VKNFLPGLVFLVLLPATVRGQSPAGAEFRVNTYTTDEQYNVAVAMDGNGDFVVVWASYAPDARKTDVFGQRFSASGTPRGDQFQINTYTTNYQDAPAVAADANGNFVVVWDSMGPDGNAFGIVGRRFDAAGVAQGTEFLVNSYTTSFQFQPSMAADASGNFVVVWVSNAQDGSAYGVFGQRFDAAGAAQGGEFRVNTYTTGYQLAASVAADASGDFVVVWISAGQDGSGYGVFGQRFDAAGVPQGGEFLVNSFTTGNQTFPRVASDTNGNFVVVWSSDAQDGSVTGIFGQRFDASGVRRGSEFRANTYTTGSQGSGTVTSDEDGNFVVLWGSNGQDGSAGGIFGQRFDAAGSLRGGEFRVNSYTPDGQVQPAAASSPDGDFIVAWESFAQDGDGLGIFGQRYGDIIFEDGFETGDIGRWSSASTDGADLFVGGPAAMGGTTAGLIAFVDDTNALFVQDDTPAGENRYRARFYFDPNGFDPGEAQSHFRTRIFIGFDGSTTRIVTLVLKRQSGAYSVEGRVRRNDGTRADTGFFPITDGPHFFEIDWIRSSAPGASDGSFTLRIDNTPVSALTFLDNDASPVDFVRMGALSIKTGAAGTLYYDQFESRRQVFIGPE